ncbi:hypothetical protein EG829_33110 [bacterium]|nr:hypothetical protein [bacterium]
MVSASQDVVTAGVCALKEKKALTLSHRDKGKSASLIGEILQENIDLYRRSKQQFGRRLSDVARCSQLVRFQREIEDIVTMGAGFLALAILTLLSVCGGLFTASSYALFMGVTEPGVGTTQFSVFMAAPNACESWSAPAVGRIIPSFGYGAAFAAMAAVSLTMLLCVWVITVKDAPGRSHA